MKKDFLTRREATRHRRMIARVTTALSVLAVLVASSVALLIGSTSASANTEPSCIKSATWTYTFDGVASGVITVTADGAAQGDKLCNPLAVRATTFTYVLPASGSPSWPQKLNAYADVLVDSIGTFTYGIGTSGTCQQGDVYAAWASENGFDALDVPDVLEGPGNPHEPRFLHQALPGAGPNPTYSFTTSDSCNTPPETPKPTTTTTDWKDVASYVCGDATVTQTQSSTTTTYSWELKDGQWAKVETTGEPVVTTKTRPPNDTEVQRCKPETPPAETTTTGWVDNTYACASTSATKTNTTKTTYFGWKLQNGAWTKVVTGQTSSQETRTRDVTSADELPCSAVLAATGAGDVGWYAALAALISAVGTGLLLVKRHSGGKAALTGYNRTSR